jgi:hypothetical protein
MRDLMIKTGILSLRNIISYKIIGNTIAETIREHILDLDVIIPALTTNHNIHCINNILFDMISTAILLYILAYNIQRESSTTTTKIQRLENMTEDSSSLRRVIEKTVWILFYILTKNIENAI